MPNLRAGQFSFIVEIRAPLAEQPYKLAMAPLQELAKYVKQDKRICCLAVTDGNAASHPLGDVAVDLGKTAKKEVIVRLSGQSGKLTELREQLAVLQGGGVLTVTAATGAAHPNHPMDRKGRPLPWPEGYLDSTKLIHILRELYTELTPGAWVNPYKYTVADAFLQYFKMVKKLRTGAAFLMTEAGWDMRKLQEMQWFMRSRGLDDPAIARLLILAPSQVPAVLDGEIPGLTISREFGALLQREAVVNDNQALSAQIERLALHSAGCRLIGYSGVQLAGIESADTAKAIIDRSFQLMEELPDFASWARRWHDFHAQIEMAPHPHRYYIFQKLMDPDFPDYDPKTTLMTEEHLELPSAFEKFQFKAADVLGLATRKAFPFNLLRRMICGDDSAHDWQLGKTELLSAADCPKGLEEGVCAGSRPDGSCEFGHEPCFYHQVLMRANWRHDLDKLEDPSGD